MLSREDRILSELIVSRGLARPEIVEKRARLLEDSDETGLVQALVSHGELDVETGRQVHEEAREIDDLLRADLPEGKTLGEFRLIREIGRGGMGIVYEAEQPSLGRRVALKVLPAGAALDERLAIRFLREARTAARLQHPGIVPVFGTGREQGVLFFAMELIEGESLAARIDRGSLPPQEAASIASEIAHALQHAHEAGLIHRDVKPENVMIGTDGRARLTDFGLVHDVQGARLTRSQYVLGTPAYSAPEQARGAAADPRSDVYGAGAVLYAMLSGKPPFTGEVPAAVISKLVSEPPPPLGTVAPQTPQALVALCERAMARDAARRYAKAGELAGELDRFIEHGGAVTAADGARPSVWPRIGIGLAIAALLIVAAFVGFRPGRLAPIDSAATSRVVGLPEGAYRRLPTNRGHIRSASPAPDGLAVAYSADRDGESLIYLQRLDQTEPTRPIPVQGMQAHPSWSPDGARLSYCRDAELEVIELASGTIEKVSSTCGPTSWAPDGRGLVYQDRAWPMTRLRMIDLASGVKRLISKPGSLHPSWSPDGSRIAFVALWDGQWDLWSVPANGGDAVRVTNDGAREWHPVWSTTPGRVYYGSNRDGSPDLWTVQLEMPTGNVASDPAPLTRGWAGARFMLGASRQAELLTFTNIVTGAHPWSLRVDSAFEPVGSPRPLAVSLPLDASSPQRAPGREDWVAAANVDGASNLRRYGLDASTVIRVTEGPHRDEAPRWSPDGETIAFHSDRSGNYEIWTVKPDGTQLKQVTRSESDARCATWSADGEQLAYAIAGRGAWVLSLADGKAHPLETGPGFEPSSWSADGRRLAGTLDGVAVFDLDDRTTTHVTNFGARPVWADDGLLFAHDNRVYHWRDETGEPRSIWIGGPKRLHPGLSPGVGDGEIYFATVATTDEIWLLEPDAALRE